MAFIMIFILTSIIINVGVEEVIDSRLRVMTVNWRGYHK